MHISNLIVVQIDLKQEPIYTSTNSMWEYTLQSTSQVEYLKCSTLLSQWNSHKYIWLNNLYGN